MTQRYRLRNVYLICAFCIVLLASRGNANNSGTRLRCLEDSIYIELSERFLSEREIDATDSKQIHFNGHPECHSNSELNGYSVTLFPPYKNCGTKVEPSADTYAYSNEIVFVRGSSTIRIFTFRCDYDKKYVVSSDLSLTPTMRTLNFVTARGKFNVEMGLYQRSDFNPKSMFSQKPTILVGTPVYVSVDVGDVFGMKEIVSTIDACYATDDKNHAIQKLYHSLIVNRCSSPDDSTVQIITNGKSMTARFRFVMFKWKNNIEYLYLHCAVKVCNRTEEECSGFGPVCTGVHTDQSSRKRRENPEESLSSPIQGYKGIVTVGPVAMTEKDTEEETGVGTYEAVYEKIYKDQKFLQVYIYTAVAAAIVVAGIIAIVVTVVSKKRAGRRQKLDDSTESPPNHT